MRAYALVLTIAGSLAFSPAALAQAPVTGGADATTTAPATTDDPSVSTGGAAYGQPNPAITQLTPEQAHHKDIEKRTTRPREEVSA